VKPVSSPLSKGSLLLIGVFLLVLVVGVYSQVFQFGLVEYDDPAFLRDNPYVNGGVTWGGVKWAFFHGDAAHVLRAGTENLWHPLTWLSQMLDFQCWGSQWGGHHGTALLLHAISVFLVWALGVRVTRSHPVALVAALLFALHPMHAETVSWLSERKGVLCGFFSLLSLLSYRYSTLVAHRRRWARVGSVVFLILALMSKPSAVVLPVLLLVIDWLDRYGEDSTLGPGLRGQFLNQLRDKWIWFLPAGMVAALA